MLGVLLKTIPVDLRKNAGTYLLMCLLVAVSMYVASAFSAITYSYTVGSEQNYLASNYQDGQFQTTTPLTASEEEAIKGHGYNLERAFYFDVDEEDGSTLRIMRVRKAIDLPILDDGSLPVTDDEALLEKCYAYMHELTAGDTMEIGARPMKISGVGSVTDYNMPSRGMMDYSSDSEAFGLAFVTDDAYASMLKQPGDDTRENYIYSYKLAEGSSDEDLRVLLAGNSHMLEKVTAFTPRDNNNRMCSAQNDNAPYAAAGLIVDMGLLVLIAMVFFLKSRMSLERDSAAIGALIATGVSRRDVMLMVLAPSAIVALVGGAIGYLLSLAFPLEEVAASEGFYSIPYIPIISHPAILAYCLLSGNPSWYPESALLVPRIG